MFLIFKVMTDTLALVPDHFLYLFLVLGFNEILSLVLFFEEEEIQ